MSKINKVAQVNWEPEIDPNDVNRYKNIEGHKFNLQRKGIKGSTDEIIIPFNSVPNMDEQIKDSYYKKVVGTPEDCFSAIKKNPSLAAARDSISSAFILRDGICVLNIPHTHDETARSILPNYMLPETHEPNKAFGMSINSDHMPLYARALRAQFRPTGLGVTIDMLVPPTEEQINAIRDYYNLTSKEYFVAEIKWDRELLGRIVSLDNFLLFLSKGFPIKDEYKDVPTEMRDYIEETDPIWLGQQKMARNKNKRELK
jgi:hypothetical protein